MHFANRFCKAYMRAFGHQSFNGAIAIHSGIHWVTEWNWIWTFTRNILGGHVVHHMFLQSKAPMELHWYIVCAYRIQAIFGTCGWTMFKVHAGKHHGPSPAQRPLPISFAPAREATN